jgi:predicted RNA-binding Zn-ribbon protein involved in translation (DUF1610 family)
LLIYRAIHSDELCDGGTDGPRGCPDANDVTCGQCGLRRTADDSNAPGACPQCGAWRYTVNRCAHCKLDDLDHARAHSSAGRLLDRLLELEFSAAHFDVPWTDVTAEEVRGLQILKDERDRYQREQAEKNRHGLPN